MFIDKARIYIKAGNGGNGCTSFFTAKGMATGGPDGGDGGNGGDIVFVCDMSINTLLDFSYSQHFRAPNGDNGTHRFSHGKRGDALEIRVPRGTIIKDYDSGHIIADMFNDGERIVVLTGGNGGKGNSRFKSSRRHAPHFSQTGQITEEKSVILELKTIADVGLVGFPNVGKSTILSVVSSARPKIANYHFTTLSPNLGVVKFYDKSFVVADIPGLIEGASDGVGLGTDFLRHIERTRLIVHVIDVSGVEGRDPVDDYNKINQELKNFSPKLAKLKQIIVLNKIDILGGDMTKVKEFKSRIKGKTVLVSGATREGIDLLIKEIFLKLEKLPALKPIEHEPFEYERDDSSFFEITRDDDGAFVVFGGMIDELARNVILDDYDSLNYFQKMLKNNGVIKSLKRNGAQDGDLVRILDIEFDFVD